MGCKFKMSMARYGRMCVAMDFCTVDERKVADSYFS